MKRLREIGCVVALCGCAWVGMAQNVQPAPAEAGILTRQGGNAERQAVEVLSDTQGVDFKPYVKDMLNQIYGQWLTLMPEEARASQNKRGATLIRVTVSPDGTIAAMHLDASAHDEALNRAAWGAVTGVGRFAPLPKEFHGPDLELRIHFVVNEGSAGSVRGKTGL